MNIKQIYKEKIKIKDLAYLNELGAEIVEFYPKNDLLEGKLYVTGNYRSLKNDIDKLISHDLPFSIVFENSDFYIEDIECVSFNYNLIEGSGIEIEYEISVTYDSNVKEDNSDNNINQEEVNNINEERNLKKEELINEERNLKKEELINEEVNNKLEVENEIIKEEISESVDQKLSAKLEIVENLPQEENITRNLKEEKTTLKIIYYQNENELDQIAKNNNCSIDSIYKQNRKNNINSFKRVIIKNGK